MKESTIKERFQVLDSERATILDRKRECAEFTFPDLLPPYGYTDNDDLETPLNSAPALGSSSLAAKIANAVLPTNGSSIVTPEVPIPDALDQRLYEEVNNVITAYDRAIMSDIQSSNFRPELHAVSLDLVVIGDTLLELLPNDRYRKHRLDNYVVIRKEDGSIHELIIRVWVDPETLPEDMQKRTGSTEVRSGSRRLEPKFIRVIDEGDRYSVEEEFRGVSDGTSEYTVLPYFALKTGKSAADNYGRSIIEGLMGDIRSLMAHSLSLLQGSAANSEFRLCVDPTGPTDLVHLSGSENGSWVSARASDLHVMQLGNPVQVQITMAAVEKYETAILKALLYDLVYAGQNRERVTATEINATIQSIESGLSGILSSITQELHVPLVRRLSYELANRPNTPDPVRALAKQVVSGGAPLKLRSGIEALHREIRSMRLIQGINTLSGMPPQASADIKWRNVVADLMSGLGFESGRYLLTEEEKQQAAQQQAALNVAEQTGIAAGQQAAINGVSNEGTTG